MRSMENNCMGCTGMGLPCMGSACRNSRPALVIKCDVCGEECDRVWDIDGIDICEDCIKEGQKKEFLEFLGDEWYDELWDEYRDSYLENHKCYCAGDTEDE